MIMGMPFEVVSGGVKLNIHLQPGAKRTAFAGLYGERLKVAVQAPPVDGKANAALAGFIAEMLDLPVRDVILSAGTTSRDKTFLVKTQNPELAFSKLENLIK